MLIPLVKILDPNSTKEEGFDVLKLAGAIGLASVSLTPKKSKPDENMNLIESVVPTPKGTVIPDQINETKTLTLDADFDETVFDSLPDFLKKKIQESEQYENIIAGNSQANSKPESENNQTSSNENDGENVPF